MPIYTLADVELALNTPPSPSDGPGELYGLEVTHPDGTVVLKVGRSIEPVRRTEEWECQCWKDDIVLLWTIKTKFASKLERVCHRFFKAKQGWRTPTPCESCQRNHREKFWPDKLGGWEQAKKDAERLAERMRDRGE
ncbi:hypothetical protein B0H13DRAFT_2326061 [Mycena leptocephala]|nr:hypothetical protein B0H13DRAFT_2350479 [Mycena leptocephala]KAJ7913677.1 hypothetical protein B0H13DRAFT_2326061 [Mycena leptocephala]